MPSASLSGIEFTIRGNSDSASNSIARLTNQLDKLKSSLASTSGVKNMTNGIKQVGNEAKKANKPLDNLFASIKRIAFYRMIRGAIKAVTQAFSEGLKNAYQFSKAMGDAGGLASALDNIATKSLTMKNQMGAAFGGLITAITPIAIQVINIVNTIAAAITRLIAILGGRSTWLRAKDVWTEWGEAASGAGGAAKEALRYLAPFDELNRLPSENKGGGGGGASTPDYSSMFEEVSTEVGAGLLDSLTEAFQNVANWFESKDWQNLGAAAWAKLKELFSDGGKASELVSALLETIGAACGAILATAWGFLKGLADDLFQHFKDNIIDYNGNDKIDVLDILTAAFKTAVDFGQWYDEHIIQPFWRGFKSAFLGKNPSADNKITLKDILNKLFGQTSGSGTEVGITVPVTGIQDKIPTAQKTLKDMIAEIASRRVNKSKFDMTLHDLVAEFSSRKLNKSKFDTTLHDIAAEFSSRILNKSKFDTTLHDLRAEFSYKSLSSKFNNTIDTVANFLKRTFGAGFSTTIDVIANFFNRLFANTFSSTIDSIANFTTRSIADTFSTWFDSVANFVTRSVDSTTFNTWFDAGANFITGVQGYLSAYAPVVEAIASMINPYWKYGTPTMDVNASVGSHSGHSGTFAKGGAYYGGTWHSIPQAANGGSFHGTLFWAGENGAEVVGNAGGRTEVLNRSQLASTMYSAVRTAIASTASSNSGMSEESLYRVFLRALNDADNSVEVDVDGNVLFRTMVQKNRENTRLTGVNALA